MRSRPFTIAAVSLLATLGACSGGAATEQRSAATDQQTEAADVPRAGIEAQALAEARATVTLPPDGAFRVVAAESVEAAFSSLAPNEPVRVRLPGMEDWPEVCLPLLEHRSADVTNEELDEIRKAADPVSSNSVGPREDVDYSDPAESIPSTSVARRPVIDDRMREIAELAVIEELEAEACGTRMRDYEKELTGTPVEVVEPDHDTPTPTTTLAP